MKTISKEKQPSIPLSINYTKQISPHTTRKVLTISTASKHAASVSKTSFPCVPFRNYENSYVSVILEREGGKRKGTKLRGKKMKKRKKEKVIGSYANGSLAGNSASRRRRRGWLPPSSPPPSFLSVATLGCCPR